MSKPLNLIGHKYGKLTPVQLTKSKQGERAWLCKCDCGNQVIVVTDALRSGNTKSCGCNRIVDIAGFKFGRLTVIELVKGHREAHWRCKCECGNEIITRGASLRSGVTQSCGCLGRDMLRERVILPKGVAAMNQSFHRLKNNAAERGYEFNLTKEQALSIMQQNCHYCGLPPSNVSYHPDMNGTYTYNGIDRVDNLKGYDIDNVVSCCKHCNYAKRDRTVDEFLAWVKRVYQYSVM